MNLVTALIVEGALDQSSTEKAIEKESARLHRGVEAPERVAVLAYDELPEPASVNLRRAEKQRAAPRQPYLLEVPAHVLVKRTK